MFINSTIVFIDDDKDDIFLFTEIIREAHPELSALTFSDPEMALQFLSGTNEMPICIVCDFNMPKLDGFKLRSLLLKTGGPIAAVPFFILSTVQVDWQELLSKKLQIHACYLKDISVDEIAKTIEEILGKLK